MFAGRRDRGKQAGSKVDRLTNAVMESLKEKAAEEAAEAEKRIVVLGMILSDEAGWATFSMPLDHARVHYAHYEKTGEIILHSGKRSRTIHAPISAAIFDVIAQHVYEPPVQVAEVLPSEGATPHVEAESEDDSRI